MAGGGAHWSGQPAHAGQRSMCFKRGLRSAATEYVSCRTGLHAAPACRGSQRERSFGTDVEARPEMPPHEPARPRHPGTGAQTPSARTVRLDTEPHKPSLNVLRTSRR